MPLGSGFKLWVLGALAEQIAAGRHKWSDVVPLGTPSLPSGMLQNWPKGAPVTVQTLATLMISISDNTATDTLIGLVGRDAIDAHARAGGLSVPVLTTREAFAIKAEAGLTAAWKAADPARRTTLLRRNAARFAAATLDVAAMTGSPVANGEVEWFASPQAVARQLDRLRRLPDPVVLQILSVSAGAAPAVAVRFAYLGYKGGSEPGVIALNYLARDRNGGWWVISTAWTRPDAAIDGAAFAALAGRALLLVQP
ncbi:serine hydrolase [Sphingomonas aracearum]|nr:serine hydrolase [Sphingomonas aracearum]